MMKKRLSKKIWYGSDIDSEGKPVLPPLAKDSEDLEGLHYGELYLHIADDKLSLWTRTLTDQIKQIGGEGSGGELWKLMETESGEKYIFSAFDVATQKGITSYVNGGMLDLPSIYDGLVIDNRTIVWEKVDGVKTLVAKGSGNGEGTIKDVVVDGDGNAITNVEVIEGVEGKSDKLVFTKGLTFVDKTYLAENYYTKTDLDGKYVTVDDTPQDIDGEKNFIGSLMVNGMPIVYDYRGFWKLEGDLLVTGGISSFSSDTRYSPSTVMDGIVCDEQTISADGGFLHFVGEIKGGISDVVSAGSGNAVTSLSVSADGESVTYYKGMTFAEKQYVDDNFSKKTYVDETFVTLKGDPQVVESQKNFIGGLQVNGSPIVYNSEKGYWKLDGDLLVTGGIAFFSDDTAYEPTSVMDAIVCDEQTITIVEESGVKKLKVIGGSSAKVNWEDIEDAPTSLKNPFALVINGTAYDGSSRVEINISEGGGTADSVHWDNVEGKPSWIGSSKPSYSWTEITGKPSWIGSSKPSYSWSEITGKPNFVTEEDLEEEGFLTAMDIQVLTFTSGTFKAVSYDPSMAPKTVNIPTKLSHLEDDSDFVTLGMMSSYATKTWVGQQGFATEDWVDENYFSINGGQLHGDLWLRSGTENYGRRIIFGDVRTSNGQPYVYIGEDTDDDLTIASWGDFRIKVGDGAYLTYIKDDGYWEITGDLLVTGGITSYA